MKSKQKSNNRATKVGIKSQQINNQSDSQQLSNQIDIYTNRLNYVQETITKLQRKINKLQKTISTTQQIQSEFKDQIGQKIKQMIEIMSIQQHGNNQKNSNKKVIETIQTIKQEMKRLSKSNNILTERFQNIDQRVVKIQNLTNINKRQIKNLIQDKVIQIEKRINHQISSNISHVYQVIEQMQTKITNMNKLFNNKKEQHDHKVKKYLQDQQKFNNNSIDSPNFTKTNYKNSFSKEKNNKTYRNPQTNTYGQNNHLLSKKLEINQNSSDIFKRKTETFDTNDTLSSNKVKNMQNTPVSENSNSRVVYLRQKLKQFEDINKKYEMKQKQFQSNNSLTSGVSSQFSSSKFKSASKDSSQKSKQVSLASNREYEGNSGQAYLMSHKKSNTQLQPQRISFQRQSSSKKDYTPQIKPTLMSNINSSTFSSNKSSFLNQGLLLNREQSAKKIDKLKSIRDYLQQTQSEIDQSLLQPNYN